MIDKTIICLQKKRKKHFSFIQKLILIYFIEFIEWQHIGIAPLH